MRDIKRVMTCLLLSVIICLFTTETQAAVNEDESKSASLTLATPVTSFSTTVTDSEGNKYRVYGTVFVSGKTAAVTTGYEVTYIGDGLSDSTVYNYGKTVGAKADVSMSGGATNTIGSYGHLLRGRANSFSDSKTFLYRITTLFGHHRFNCNGKYYSRDTEWY